MGLGTSSFAPATGSWYQVKFESKLPKINVDNDAELRQIFQAYDTDKNGYLTREEIIRALTHLHLDVDDANELFDELDENHENKITWEVFKKHAKEVEGELRELFDAIDTEKLGYISSVEMATALTKLGIHPTTAGISDLLELLDEGLSSCCCLDCCLFSSLRSPPATLADHDGFVKFHDFKQVFTILRPRDLVTLYDHHEHFFEHSTSSMLADLKRSLGTLQPRPPGKKLDMDRLRAPLPASKVRVGVFLLCCLIAGLRLTGAV